MDLLLFLLGIIGLPVGIALLIVGIVKKRRLKGGIVIGVSVALCLIGLLIPTGNKELDEKETVEVSADVEEETPEEKAEREAQEAEEKAAAEQKAKEEVEVKDNLTWTESVEEIVSNGGTETEKADSVELLARDYNPTNEELTAFSDEIINEFKSKEYIMNLNNEIYTLSNLFKSIVVERNADEPMKSFAYDFYQNTKYNYRGVETMLSDSTISNEEQMKEALADMGK